MIIGYNQLLDSFAMHLQTTIRHFASDMILAVHSDDSYLSEPGSKSHFGGYYFLSNDTIDVPNNRAVLTLSVIIFHLVPWQQRPN